jgi:hypothetical protein
MAPIWVLLVLYAAEKLLCNGLAQQCIRAAPDCYVTEADPARDSKIFGELAWLTKMTVAFKVAALESPGSVWPKKARTWTTVGNMVKIDAPLPMIPELLERRGFSR